MTETTEPTTRPAQRVVCAAIRHEHGMIICGARHFDSIMRANVKLFTVVESEQRKWWQAEQGFVDQYGVFLTREEAWKIAEREKQIRRTVAPSGALYSENLY